MMMNRRTTNNFKIVMDTQTMPTYGHDNLPNIRQGVAPSTILLSEMLSINQCKNIKRPIESMIFSLTLYNIGNSTVGTYVVTPTTGNNTIKFAGTIRPRLASALWAGLTYGTVTDINVQDICFATNQLTGKLMKVRMTLNNGKFILETP